MIGKVNGLVKAAASASLVAGAIMATAGPAAAAGPNTSDGAAATGLITLAPVAPASFPGTSPASVANLNVAGLITTGLITDTADATDASSTIADVGATLTARTGLTATAVTLVVHLRHQHRRRDRHVQHCRRPRHLAGIPLLTLAANAAPNTTVNVPGVATITLNRQVTAADGTLTVDAIYVNLLTAPRPSPSVPAPATRPAWPRCRCCRAWPCRSAWARWVCSAWVVWVRRGPPPPDGPRRRLKSSTLHRPGACAPCAGPRFFWFCRWWPSSCGR